MYQFSALDSFKWKTKKAYYCEAKEMERVVG